MRFGGMLLRTPCAAAANLLALVQVYNFGNFHQLASAVPGAACSRCCFDALLVLLCRAPSHLLLHVTKFFFFLVPFSSFSRQERYPPPPSALKHATLRIVATEVANQIAQKLPANQCKLLHRLRAPFRLHSATAIALLNFVANHKSKLLYWTSVDSVRGAEDDCTPQLASVGYLRWGQNPEQP